MDLTMATLTKKVLLKEYIRRDFYWPNIAKYRKCFDEWYGNLIEIQLEFWRKRMDGQIC